MQADYTLDDSVGLGRMFDGIGGLSAGVRQLTLLCASKTLFLRGA